MKVMVISILLALSPVNVYAISGNELVKSMRDYDKYVAGNGNFNQSGMGMYVGYVSGIFEAMRIGRVICPNQAVVNGQAIEIVSGYIKSNPEKWNLDAINLVYTPLILTFPCR